MSKSTLFNQFFTDHKEVFPVIAMLDESASPASLARARQAWWGHGECRLDSLSEYLHHTLISILGFHDDSVNWDGITYHYIEFGSEKTAREAFVEATLSEDCVRGALRFTNRDHGSIIHQYRRMEGLIQLNEAIDLLDGNAINYCDELQRENGENTRLPDFECIEQIREK